MEIEICKWLLEGVGGDLFQLRLGVAEERRVLGKASWSGFVLS